MLAIQNNAWELREFTKIPSDSLLEESVSDPECGDGGGGSSSSSVTSEPYSTSSSSVLLSEPCSSNSSVSAPSPPPPEMIDDDDEDDLTIPPMEIPTPTKLSSSTTTVTTTTTTNSDPQRVAVLSFEQVRRLNDVMNDTVSIHGRGNFPTLEVRLRDLVQVVRSKLEQECEGANPIKVRDIRLNGGCASHVLASESQNYNDLDLIFAVELSGQKQYDRVKQAVLASLLELLPEGVSRKRISTCSLKEAYVSKMVKVNDGGDRWSLISLGNQHRGGKNVELKFVDSMRRQFEFSVDSFQVVLDSLLSFYNCSDLEISENFYPTVVGESVYGDIQEALYHLHKKMIATRQPEEIRGGGLLKYCHLLTRGYKAAAPDKIKTLERYMCSRFFIDFSDILQQRTKLENYLWNHMAGETSDQYRYLTLLHAVVEESTVCLMGHERRQTLSLIEELACHVLCAEQHQRLMMFQQNAAAAAAAGMVNTTHHHHHGKHNGAGLAVPPPPPVLYNGYYYAPVIPANCIPCTCTWMTCS